MSTGSICRRSPTPPHWRVPTIWQAIPSAAPPPPAAVANQTPHKSPLAVTPQTTVWPWPALPSTSRPQAPFVWSRGKTTFLTISAGCSVLTHILCRRERPPRQAGQSVPLRRACSLSVFSALPHAVCPALIPANPYRSEPNLSVASHRVTGSGLILQVDQVAATLRCPAPSRTAHRPPSRSAAPFNRNP